MQVLVSSVVRISVSFFRELSMWHTWPRGGLLNPENIMSRGAGSPTEGRDRVIPRNRFPVETVSIPLKKSYYFVYFPKISILIRIQICNLAGFLWPRLWDRAGGQLRGRSANRCNLWAFLRSTTEKQGLGGVYLMVIRGAGR